MPLLEVLPNSSTTSAPGWAYVPDTGLDPVKAGHVPRNPRKRVAGGGTGGAHGIDLTARQQAALTKRLAELDRDNARDATIAIPSRAKGPDGGGRGMETAAAYVLKTIMANGNQRRKAKRPRPGASYSRKRHSQTI
jgi:zinc finger HIT domain-containing protein 1